jgi:hypothetical protein
MIDNMIDNKKFFKAWLFLYEELNKNYTINYNNIEFTSSQELILYFKERCKNEGYDKICDEVIGLYSNK